MKPAVLFVALVAAVAGCEKADSEKIEALEARIETLEAAQKQLAEVDAFVRPIMKEQEQRAMAEAAKEPAEDVRFAVNVEGNEYDGPEGAAVTVVEAFDFA